MKTWKTVSIIAAIATAGLVIYGLLTTITLGKIIKNHFGMWDDDDWDDDDDWEDDDPQPEYISLN